MNFIPKYKTRIKFLINLISAGLIVSSCNKLIEIPPNAPNQIVTEQVFADSAGATAAVVQLYTNFSYPVLGVQAGGFTVYPALSADELNYSSADNTLISEGYANNISVNNGTLTSFWQSIYSSSAGGIYQANACIEGISASPGISTSIKNQLIGEAEVMRAFLYFNMVNWFGGVPLVTGTDYLTNKSLARASETEIYTQIISDLKDAEQRLVAAYPSNRKARPNKFTAAALLAKVYVYTKDWQDAAAESSVIINSGQYQLEPDLNNVFLRGSIEAIWQIESVYSWIQTTEGTVFVPYSSNIIPRYFLTTSLMNAFEPGDKRLQNWVGTNNVPSGNIEINYQFPYKYKNGSSPEDYVIFRLGEQYLIRAEAESEMGDQESAIKDLNIIRDRAGLAPYSGSEDANDVQPAIQHERRIELFCEFGNRWYDLKRTGTVNSVMTAEKPSTWPTDGHAALYPIPQDEIQKNSLLLQNNGY